MPSESSATTTTASVLAPRLMANEPAIGQRSTRTERARGLIGALSCVIAKPGRARRVMAPHCFGGAGEAKSNRPSSRSRNDVARRHLHETSRAAHGWFLPDGRALHERSVWHNAGVRAN